MVAYYGSNWVPNSTYRTWMDVATSQNVGANRSTYAVKLYLQDQLGYGMWNDALGRAGTVGGATIISGTFNIAGGAYASTLVGSGSRVITHNNDGTLGAQAVSCSINANNLGLGYGEVWASVGVPTIPRATTPNSGNFVTGAATTINLPRAASGFTHDVTYKFGSKTGTIATGAGVSTSWNPPHSLLTVIPNAVSGSVEITVVTKSGSTIIGTKKMTKTLAAGASIRPSVSAVAWTDENAAVKNNIGAFVQGLSLIKGAVTAAGIHGSTIASKHTTLDGVRVTEGTAVLVEKSGTLTGNGEARDTRGRIGTKTQNVSVIAYEPPKFVADPLVRRAFSNGTPADEGTYLRIDLNALVSSLIVGSTQKNALKINVRTRPNNGSWTARNEIKPGLAYNSNFLVSGGGIFSIASSYDVEITLTDNTGAQPSQVITTVATAAVTMHWNGNSVGVGKMHEQGALDVGGDIFMNGDLVSTVANPFRTFATFAALNAWAAPDGAMAYVSADNAQYVRMAGEWLVSARSAPKVLWTGSQFMNASQDAVFTELISDQPTGIILVWSEYANGAAQNYGFNQTFVSKYHPLMWHGAGINFVLGGTSVHRKYVYVHDDKLVGNAANANAPNNISVLRAVIGV